jgi:hypothetical protein
MKYLYLLAGLLCTLFLSAQNEGDQFFSAWTVHEIRFQFSQPGYFDSLKANYTLDAYMACDLTVDGVSYPQCGVKYKGNSSYNNPSRKKPFRVDLEQYGVAQNLDGLKKFVLNNGFKDPTLLREKLMLDFLNAHGIAAPRATFARLYINNHYWGLYSLVEDVNKTFLKDRFGNKGGNLFKGDPMGKLDWKGWTQSAYEPNYELKTNTTANDWSDLIRLINALNNASALQLPDSLGKYLNLDSWYAYWAAHSLFANLDSYIGSGHNYLIYHNTDTDKFEWITWDVNEAFGNFNMGISLANIKTLPYTFIPQPPQSRPMMNKVLPNTAMKAAYEQKLCALLQDFNNTALNPRIDSLANLIRPAVFADTLKFFSNTNFDQNLNQDMGATAGLKPFITARRTSLIAQLAGQGCTVTETSEQIDPVSIQLFPNPAGETITITATGCIPESVRIFDTNGRFILEKQFLNSAEMRIPVAHLPAGIYFVTANTGETLHLLRFSIVR